MRSRLILVVAALTAFGGLAVGQAQKRGHLNPMIDLLEQKKPVFGLYVPSNRRFGPNGPVAVTPARSPSDLAQEALSVEGSDFVFDGAMEEDMAGALGPFSELVAALGRRGIVAKSPFPHFTKAIQIKSPKIAPDYARATANIGTQLNLGVTGLMFVGVESAEEVRQGLAAMRFKSKGGTRSDDVGTAPALWGMSEKEYKQKADLWPLNPQGELVNWTIVESREGLAHVREIAAVKGIGVLWPGAGTLRGVFSSKNDKGERVFDEAGWENAIQTVLAACKEFNVPCGYPASDKDIGMRMKQGFSVFVSGWGEPGFKAVEIGRTLAARPAASTP